MDLTPKTLRKPYVQASIIIQELSPPPTTYTTEWISKYAIMNACSTPLETSSRRFRPEYLRIDIQLYLLFDSEW